MKIALLIAGYLRTFEYNIENFISNIIQENDCAIYIHITQNDNEDKYLNKNVSLDLIKQKLNPKIILISENFHFTDNSKINNLLNQNYKFYWLNKERKQIEKMENMKYDVVVKIRPDIYLNQKINFKNLENHFIYIPMDSKIDKKKLCKEDDPCICDIIAYGSTECMNKLFDFYLKVNELINFYGMVNETLLFYYLNNHKISYQLVDINYSVILSLCNTIAITGDSGSGKTTLSKMLKDLFENSFILECDRYHKWERGNENWNKMTHLNPEANYITKMNKDVFDLKIGNSIYQVDYDHNSGKFTDKQYIEKKDNIIICGLHSLYLKDNIINLKIYMDIDDNVRIPWKIKRDVEKRGYSLEKIMKQIDDRAEDFKRFIYPQKEKADIIICFYTDIILDKNNLIRSINEIKNIYLKIGIHNKFNINKIITLLNFSKTEIKDDFIYFFLNSIDNYKISIQNIILNL